MELFNLSQSHLAAYGSEKNQSTFVVAIYSLEL